MEIKGWMDATSKTKLKRFKKYYPDEYAKLTIVESKAYREIEKQYKYVIPNWEMPREASVNVQKD